MRIHFNFVNIFAASSEKYLIAIDNIKLSSFSELKKFIFRKFELKNILQHENVCFTLNGSKILETEMIQDYLKDNDILNVEKNDTPMLQKRKRQDNENDCSFCSFIENVFYLKNNFSLQPSFKKLHVEHIHEIEAQQKDFLNREKEILTKFDEKTEEKKKKLKQTLIKELPDSEREDLPNTNKTKQKIISKYNIQPDSPQPIEVKEVIPKKNVLKHKIKENPIIPTDSSESEESISSSPKKVIPSVQKNISKTIPKPVTIQNEIVKKTAQNSSLKLNILTPEEEFQIKKATWKSLPYNINKKPEKRNEPRDFSSFNKKFTKESETTKPTQKSIAPFPYYEPKENLSFNSKLNTEPEENKASQNLVRPIEFISEAKTSSDRNLFEEKKFVNFPLSKLRENNFLKVGNLIRFKVYELSEKNEPSVSEWKIGKIVMREGNSSFKIDTLEEEVFEFFNLLAIEVAEEFVPSANIMQEDNSLTGVGQKEVKPQPNNSFKEYSIEASVAKQVNYYFSDRNYPKDDYIQAHVKKNQDAYMEIRLLLNFPKIKQVLTDESRLISILSEFIQNTPECNFELDASSQNIRKKIKNQ